MTYLLNEVIHGLRPSVTAVHVLQTADLFICKEVLFTAVSEVLALLQELGERLHANV